MIAWSTIFTNIDPLAVISLSCDEPFIHESVMEEAQRRANGGPLYRVCDELTDIMRAAIALRRRHAAGEEMPHALPSIHWSELGPQLVEQADRGNA